MAEAEADTQARSMAQIAATAYGTNFHGEVEEPAPVPEAVEEVAEAPEAEALEGAPEDTPEVEEEAEVISSLAELVESQGWDPEWVNSLRVPVKIDGETGEATFDDLVRSYQTQTAAEKRLEQAKTQAKEMRDTAQQKVQAVEAQIAVLGGLVQNAEKVLDAEVANIDWNRLRNDDPAEFAAKRDEVREKRAGIEQMKQNALHQYQQSLQAQQAQQQEQRMASLQAEREALLQAIPSWNDANTAKAEQESLVGYLTGQGFAQEDVLGASDHRLILLARKAMQFDQMQQGSNAAAKKMAKVPKVLKPGAPKPQAQIDKQQQDALKRKLRNGGSLDDAVALMQARRK